MGPIKKKNYVSQLHVCVCIQILSSPNFIADASTITRPNHSTIADVQDLTISIHRFFKYIVKKYLTLFLFPDVYVRHVEPGFLCMVTCCPRADVYMRHVEPGFLCMVTCCPRADVYVRHVEPGFLCMVTCCPRADVYVRHVEPGFLCMVTCCPRAVHTLL